MSKMEIFMISAVMAIAIMSPAKGADLAKRHQIGLRLGMWNQVTDARAEIGIGSVSTSVNASGFLGGISYCHWIEESLALDVRSGTMLAQIETNAGLFGTSSEAAGISYILLGVKYYFPQSTYGTDVRPFIRAGMGPYFGSQQQVDIDMGVVVESRSESSIGGQIGAGVDFPLGKHFMTGIDIGYNFMSDFKESIGGSKNYSGPTVSFGIGYLFGRGAGQ